MRHTRFFYRNFSRSNLWTAQSCVQLSFEQEPHFPILHMKLIPGGLLLPFVLRARLDPSLTAAMGLPWCAAVISIPVPCLIIVLLEKEIGESDRIRTCLNSFWRRAPFPSGHHSH